MSTERLLAAVSHSDVLNRAWLRFRGSRGLWAPGVPMADIAANPVGPMLKLVEEIRRGNYRPSAPQMIGVTKADGGRRELAIYAVRDRIAQRALLEVLHGRTERAMSPASYGYRPGRGVGDALACVQQHLDDGRTWVVDADIELCFDTIPRQRLLDQVARRIGRHKCCRAGCPVSGLDEAGLPLADRHPAGLSSGAVALQHLPMAAR